MKELFLVIAPAIVGFVTWWIKSNPKRQKKKLLKQINDLKDEISEAIGEKDGFRASILQRRLERLRQQSDILNKQ